MSSVNRNWNAEDYAKNSSAQLQWAKELIAKLRLKDSDSVLDIGCGDGKITAMLARAAGNGTVVGIDFSENMIKLASDKFPPEENPNLTFLRMDAANIQLHRKFEVAFSNAALHWIKDHGAVLRGVYSCLKPGGRILFQMGGCGNAADVFNVVCKITQHSRWRQYYENFTPPYYFYRLEDYEAWLPANGFRPHRIELIPKDMQHQGREGFAGWLRTTWFPYTDCLPSELRETFLHEIITEYTAAYPPDSSGRIHVKMVRLEVEAQVK